MATTPNVKRYLAHGRLVDTLPQLYFTFGRKPFTEAEARQKLGDFKHGLLARMDNLGMAVRVAGKSRVHITRGIATQWILTPMTCQAIREYYSGVGYDGNTGHNQTKTCENEKSAREKAS